jgi:hypothetical protein
MVPRMRFVFATIGCALACTSPNPNGNQNDGGSNQDVAQAQTCTYTLSGANSATGTCTVTAGYDPPSSSTPGTAIAINTGGSVFAFGSQLSAGNDFTAGSSYNEGNVVNAAGESLSGTSAWQVIINDANGDPNQGSFTLNISSTGPVVTGNNGAMVWQSPHGTLNATMPADPGASGTVTAQVTF